jgi:hypothetical protein
MVADIFLKDSECKGKSNKIRNFSFFVRIRTLLKTSRRREVTI